MKILLLPLLLVACNSEFTVGEDGYPFPKNAKRINLPVSHHYYESRKAFLAAAPPEKLEEARAQGRELKAWSALYPNKCIIHIVDPRVDYQPVWEGHEVTHCEFGEWHK